jgi:hypothetical protein
MPSQSIIGWMVFALMFGLVVLVAFEYVPH